LHEKIQIYKKEARSKSGSATEKKVRALAAMPFRVKELVNNVIARRDAKGKLSPEFIESDPLFCTAVVANLGSAYLKGKLIHHMFEYGNASMFVTLGRIRKGVVVDQETEEISVRPVIDMAFCIDERIAGGVYFARVLESMQNLTENPEVLLQRPEIPEEKIRELNLVDLSKYKPYLKLKKKKNSERARM
jgi:hypothetical protein